MMNKIQTFYKKIKNHFFPPKKTEFEKTVDAWNAIDGDRKLRLSYDLSTESIVWDVGGFKGQWASDLFSKYQPTIHIFEPVTEFAKEIEERFLHNPSITVHTYGLSNEDTTTSIALTDDRSSVYIKDTAAEQILLKKAALVFDELGAKDVSLIKINIEGGEYNLLENLIETGLIKHFHNIQVQFHSFAPNATARMEAIQSELSKTHTRTYAYPFVWENWKLQ